MAFDFYTLKPQDRHHIEKQLFDFFFIYCKCSKLKIVNLGMKGDVESKFLVRLALY